MDRTRKSHDVIENIGGHFGSSAILSFALVLRKFRFFWFKIKMASFGELRGDQR